MRELRRHGVTFAVERSADGTRYFHVEGRNAELVEHALRLAAARVDEQIRHTAARRQGDDRPPGQDEAIDDEQAQIEIPKADRATLTAALDRAGRITPETGLSRGAQPSGMAARRNSRRSPATAAAACSTRMADTCHPRERRASTLAIVGRRGW